MPEIAIIVPCCNEAETIARVVRDFSSALPQAKIFVYDNNSSDDSTHCAAEAGAIVRHERMQGKGNVIRKAFLEVEADCYVMVDGDDTYPAEAAPEMVRQVLENGVDMVIGDRLSTTYFTENKRPFHGFGNRLVCALVNRFFRVSRWQLPLADIMTGYRAFSRIFVESFPVTDQGFELKTAMTIHALDKKMNIATCGVTYRDRPSGSISKLNTWKDGAKVLLTIFNLFRHYRPLPFFGGVSAFLALLAMVLFVPVLLEYFRNGLVLRFPTLIVSGVLFSCSLLAFVCGLILDSVAKNNRERHELYLHGIYKRSR
ncbi:MAG: glycosyltransferase family 2 protein [Zoogloeaceae bacterium]|jgi:glycosyltransferase involved in cell wall biosynthesis|nr:glycosyltransferase family 2 protein [Zoogloeaceae bacterium]